MAFSENISKLRNEFNLTQEQLADKLGVTRQAISKWESGQSMPDLEKLIQLSKLFQVKMDDLLNEISPKTKPKEANFQLYFVLIFIFFMTMWVSGYAMLLCTTCFAREYDSAVAILGKDMMENATVVLCVFFALWGLGKTISVWLQYKDKTK